MSELKKLNVDGAVVKTPEEAVTATYKAIPEADIDFKAVPNSNMVKENGDTLCEGADEKMLAEEMKKLSPKAEVPEVKFMAAEQQNGDAKIDIAELKQTFTGLTKEELLKYCNDPFWVRLRWVMFVGFWLAWLAMLAGAIVIIVGAPKCAPPPPKTWWEQGPLIELDDATGLSSLQQQLPALATLKARGAFVPESALQLSDAYSVEALTPENLQAFKSLVEQAKENNVNLVVDLTPNYVSKQHDWFKKGERGELPYDNYFIWGGKNDGQPPNSWRSTLNENAWTFSQVHNQSYLHQFKADTPDLNFRNDEVVKQFDKIIQFWTKQGAMGVRLSNVKHLLVDGALKEELVGSNTEVDHYNYEFYNHARTTNQPELASILAHWKAVLLDNTDYQGLFMLADGLDDASANVMKFDNGSLVPDLPLPWRPLDLAVQKKPQEGVAKALNDIVHSAMGRFGAGAWPAWKSSDSDESLKSEMSIITMLLPGTPVFKANQVTLNEDKTATEEYTNLLGMRALPSMQYGGYNSYLLNNNTVFAYTRLKSGNPGCVVLFNPTANEARVDIKPVGGVPAEVTVHLLSHNYQREGIQVKGKVASDSVPISPRSAIVLTYVSGKE